jgi:cell fate regulator YaaT (PSP1 superfamily)
MAEIIGVRFQQAGKIYYFDIADITVELGDFVVVETSHGLELGKVIISPKQISLESTPEPIKSVIRKATSEDIQHDQHNQEKANKALFRCRELAKKLNLPMKPVSSQYNLEGNHLIIYFIAEKRVDFRELVKELSHSLRTRVELRQVGARDEAKLVGGLGKCGFPTCCTSFLCEFTPVSIKMAKEQNVALNPMKTSGVCGRLLCCLGYEIEQYREMKERLPAVGQEVITSLGKAKVMSLNPLKEVVLVELDSGGTLELSTSQIQWQNK